MMGWLIPKKLYTKMLHEQKEIFRPSYSAIEERFRAVDAVMEARRSAMGVRRADMEAKMYDNLLEHVDEMANTDVLSYATIAMYPDCSTNHSAVSSTADFKFISRKLSSDIAEEPTREDDIIWDENTSVQCWVCSDRDMRVNNDKLECDGCGYYITKEEHKILLSDDYVEIKDELNYRALAFKTLGRG
jgi:hypothetical protein